MGFKIVYQCDAPNCFATLTIQGSKLSRFREGLKNNGWVGSKSGGSCFCPKHLINGATGERQDEAQKLMAQQIMAETYAVNQYEAASILHVSPGFLQRRRFLGQTPPYSRVGNQIRYRVKDLEEFLKETRMTPVNV